MATLPSSWYTYKPRTTRLKRDTQVQDHLRFSGVLLRWWVYRLGKEACYLDARGRFETCVLDAVLDCRERQPALAPAVAAVEVVNLGLIRIRR